MADGEDAELRERELAQYLAVLQGAGQRRYNLDEGEYFCIKGAREAGATWKQVADALGLETPQAAQQRHEKRERRVAEAQGAERHCTLIRDLAAAQRKGAEELRDAIAEAVDGGVTWRAIGEALGIPHETAFRQFKAGSPIVVVKAFQSAPGAEGDPGPIETGP